MTGVMGTTFGDLAPRRGVLAPAAQDEPDDETNEQVDSKPKRTRRQRPPATRSER